MEMDPTTKANRHPEVLRRRKEINEVVLTEEEKERALYNAKIQKWNEQENADYWAEQEAKRVKPKKL